MALTKAQESIVLSFLTETGNTMDSISKKILKDFESLIPILEKYGNELDNAVRVITERSIKPILFVKDGIYKQPTLYASDRRIVRELIDWYGTKHNVVIPVNENEYDKTKEEMKILRQQSKDKVKYDALLMDKNYEIQELHSNLKNVINENTLLKKRLRELEKDLTINNSETKEKNKKNNVFMFTGPVYKDRKN